MVNKGGGCISAALLTVGCILHVSSERGAVYLDQVVRTTGYFSLPWRIRTRACVVRWKGRRKIPVLKLETCSFPMGGDGFTSLCYRSDRGVVRQLWIAGLGPAT